MFELLLVNVHSCGIGEYLLDVSLNDEIGLVYDQSDNPVTFKLVNQILPALNERRIQMIYLANINEYEEMCGEPTEGKTAMKLKLKLKLNFNL